MKIDADEKELLQSVEQAEWKSAVAKSANELVSLTTKRRHTERYRLAAGAGEPRLNTPIDRSQGTDLR